MSTGANGPNHPVDQARRLAAERFPDALSVVLAGSTASGRATVTSDLDLAVLTEDGSTSRRETLRFEGRLVELFVHTRAGLDEIFAADRASRRGIMQRMYAEGLVISERDGAGNGLKRRAEDALREGPGAMAPATVENRRYALTDALDDLADAADAVERLAVAGVVLGVAADLLFDHHRAWTGGGKWLPRRLLQADPERGGALLDAHRRLCENGDPEHLASAAAEILDLVGGPLREGYARTWQDH
ncbi:nucleotidyltransferase [Streptomyces sp. XY593]|uniref:nucleotidyltransferase domain-containing protein n=1 Tax=Streptomyces sp. XY593 TaxID=1519483 RepID=UPI0006AFA497|nr:nucleotidyltransferase domain-containing protein [Streptomyces sp. XY593]KOU79359.1 nucleotidyltransferase [Streptomyces sp. XY593]